MNEREKFMTDMVKTLFYLRDSVDIYEDIDNALKEIKTFLDRDTHWNTAAHLPTPNVPLIIMLSDGTVVKGIRPAYISSREEGDLGYRDLEDNVLLEVVKWTIA